ncbi:copper amine oxidase N-terminal domain-containing protein [Priestia filamentosa]|uniref:copper amine oxidase N-terminal domain-containing protein n=1 Tax=Priestia filamentosa TaxID=1402861 RepID=UPI00397840B0
MKKIISGVLASSIVLAGMGAQTASAASNQTAESTFDKLSEKTKVTSVSAKSVNKNQIDLLLDGGYAYDDTSGPILKNGRVLVPFRPIAEYMDATLKWDGKAKKVTITRKGTKVEITNGQKYGLVNGNKKTLDEPVQIIEGRVFVPLRFVTESLGAKINWSQKEKQVNVIVYQLGNEKYYYMNTRGELGPKISAYQTSERLDQGIKEGREVVRSFTITDVTDNTATMFTTHFGKYTINGKTYETVSSLQHDIDLNTNKITNGEFEVYAYNIKDNAEVFSYENSGKTKEFKTTDEILKYTSYQLLKNVGFVTAE